MKYILIIVLAVVMGCGGYWDEPDVRRLVRIVKYDMSTNQHGPFISTIEFGYVYCDEAIGRYRTICSNGGYKYE